MFSLTAATAMGTRAASADDRPITTDHTLATASPGGVYFPAGVAVATVVKIMLEPRAGVTLSAVTSAGSIENLGLLREEEVAFAFAQSLYGLQARRGDGPFAESGADPTLRSVTTLWPDIEQFVISRDAAETGSLADLAALKGEAMAFGDLGSGALGSTRILLKGLGLDAVADFELFHAPYDSSADALARGAVAGLAMPAGAPTPAIVALLEKAGDRLALLDVTDAEFARINKGVDLWRRHVIRPGTYPGQTKPWRTLAQPNFLATRAGVPEEDVYQITRTLFEQRALLGGLHPALTALSLESALSGLPAPLHPGALRYYREAGLTVPATLTPE